jgi:hypothetical protein
MGRYGLFERPGGRERADRAHWAAIAAFVRFRAEGRCEACRGTAGPFEHHHVIKRSQGGPDQAWNIAYLCRPCHAATDRPYLYGRLVCELFYAPPAYVPMRAANIGDVDEPWLELLPGNMPDGTRDPDGIRVSMQYGVGKHAITRTEFVRLIWNLS